MSRWAFAVALSLCLTGAAAAQEIVIAASGPTTGGDGSLGRQMRNGAEQAVADINAAGGVLGRPVRLEMADDACDPKQARSVAEKFAGMRVQFVVGHFCSAASITASEVYAEANILQISPASTSPLYTDRKLWNTFRLCGRDDQQGEFIARYVAKNFADKKIALVHDKTTHGKGLVDGTRATLNTLKVRETLYESYNKGEKDFTAIVSKLKRFGIDLVVVGGYQQEAGLMLRQLRDQGMSTVMIGGDALANREFAAVAGAAAEGALFTFGPDPRKNPLAAPVVQAFAAKGIDPDGYTLYTYSAVQLWAQAAAKAGSTDGRKVAAALRAGKWPTPNGEISFDAKGDTSALGWAVYKWDNAGNYSEVTATP